MRGARNVRNADPSLACPGARTPSLASGPGSLDTTLLAAGSSDTIGRSPGPPEPTCSTSSLISETITDFLQERKGSTSSRGRASGDGNRSAAAVGDAKSSSRVLRVNVCTAGGPTCASRLLPRQASQKQSPRRNRAVEERRSPPVHGENRGDTPQFAHGVMRREKIA
jgi:hypothetical protein